MLDWEQELTKKRGMGFMQIITTGSFIASRCSATYLEISRKPVCKLLGKLCDLIVKVDGGSVLEQRVLLVDSLHDFVVTVAHTDSHNASKTLQDMQLFSPAWRVSGLGSILTKAKLGSINTGHALKSGRRSAPLQNMSYERCFIRNLCFVLHERGERIGSVMNGSAHIKISPASLVKEVLHFALHDHDWLLEVVEQGCCKLQTSVISQLCHLPFAPVILELAYQCGILLAILQCIVAEHF